jgi:hypothetical protein
MVQLKNGSIPTGNTTLDNLITKYHLHLATYYPVGITGTHTVELYSDSNYNVPKMEAEFMAVSGMMYFVPGLPIGGGSYVLDTVTSNYVALSYWYGWGDCLSGCLFYRYWNFRVAYDCKVTYMGSGGATLDPVTIARLAPEKVTVYPNPATDELNIGVKQRPGEKVSVIITDITGRVVYQGDAAVNSRDNPHISLSIQSLQTGTYFYQVGTEADHLTGKFFKQ